MQWITPYLIKRFEDKFEPITETGCWIWTASNHERGYGLFYTGRKIKAGKMEFAHRVSYEIYKNYSPKEGEEVCHVCDNPSCVNPDHLFIGSHTDNMRDMMSKNRWVTPKEKVTKEQVDEMIKLREEGVMIKYIADSFKISQSHASRLTRGLRKYYNES